MKRIQIIPKEGYNLYGAIVQKEVDLGKKKVGTFYRSGRKTKDKAKWAHKKYPGWVKLQYGMGGIVIAEVRTMADTNREWALLNAFMGFLDRHFGQHIQSINIQYMDLPDE
jgi:hypothetical protein